MAKIQLDTIVKRLKEKGKIEQELEDFLKDINSGWDWRSLVVNQVAGYQFLKNLRNRLALFYGLDCKCRITFDIDTKKAKILIIKRK